MSYNKDMGQLFLKGFKMHENTQTTLASPHFPMAEIISTGPRNDYIAKVDIAKANGGYYSKSEPITQFIAMGINPILNLLPSKFNYYDFGGGSGLLSSRIHTYLKHKGFDATTTVVDANPRYLDESSSKGLDVQQANLETCRVQDCSLITMRGVNHYNSLKTQKRIYKNAFKQLNKNCYFISSICSGPKRVCQFKSDVVNLSYLGRVYEKNQIYTTSVDEYMNLLEESGFIDVQLLGYTLTQKWCPIDIWERSNRYLEIEAKDANDMNLLSSISTRKNAFFKQVDVLLSDLVEEILNIKLTGHETDKYSLIPDTEYPIIKAYKP